MGLDNVGATPKIILKTDHYTEKTTVASAGKMTKTVDE